MWEYFVDVISREGAMTRYGIGVVICIVIVKSSAGVERGGRGEDRHEPGAAAAPVGSFSSELRDGYEGGSRLMFKCTTTRPCKKQDLDTRLAHETRHQLEIRA
jgi:hypothetical protein